MIHEDYDRELNKYIQDCIDSEYQDWINEQIENNHQNSEQ